jgi:outer membrane protein
LIKPKKTILLILLVLTGQILTALSIDLNEAWSLMENSNLSLRTLELDQAAALREVESLSHLVPGISFSTSLTRSAPLISSFTDSSNQGRTEVDNWSLRGGVDLRLSLKPTVSAENQVQALLLNILLLQREIKIRDLRADLQKLFYEIDAGTKTISLQERILNLTQNRLNQVEVQYKKGLKSELELLTAQIAVSRDKPLLQKARIDQEKRLINFRETLGLEPDIFIDLNPMDDLEIPSELSREEILARVKNNEEMRMAWLQLELVRKNREYSGKNLRSPSLGFSLGWSTSLNPLFDRDSWTSEEWSDSLGLGISLSVPIDPWFKGSDAGLSLEKLDDSIRKQELTVEDSLRKMEDLVRSLILDIDLSSSNLKVKELNITLQELTYNKVRQNYENGRTSLLDLDNSRQELQKALVAMEDEKLKMNSLIIDLNQIISGNKP